MKRRAAVLAMLALCVPAGPRAYADKLQDAVDALTALHVFNTLELGQDQIRRCLALVDTIRREQADFERKQRDTLAPTQVVRALELRRDAAIRGLKADLDAQRAVGKLLADRAYNQQVHDQALDRLVRSLQSILYPEQNSRIDWGKPAEEEDELPTGEDEALRYSLHLYALQTIDRARTLGGQYQARRIEVADDYLAAVAPPGSPLYDQLLPYVLDIFARARMMSWLEWVQYRDVLAGQLVELVGIGQEPPTAARAFNLELIRQVLESPVTPGVLQEMLAAGRR